MMMFAAAVLYGLIILIGFSLFLITVQPKAHICSKGIPGCPCTTSKAVFYVHSAESRNAGAHIPGAAEDARRLAEMLMAGGAPTPAFQGSETPRAEAPPAKVESAVDNADPIL